MVPVTADAAIAPAPAYQPGRSVLAGSVRRSSEDYRLFVAFEAGLVDLALGAPVARVVGGAADYVADAASIGLGAWWLPSKARSGPSDVRD